MDSGSVIAIAAELPRVDFGVYSKFLVTAKVASFQAEHLGTRLL